MATTKSDRLEQKLDQITEMVSGIDKKVILINPLTSGVQYTVTANVISLSGVSLSKSLVFTMA